MKIGIVGSRKRRDKEKVFALVDELSPDDVVVSGGCKGVDRWAEQRAKERGIKTIIYRPDLKNVLHKGDMVERYYARNRKIVEECDILYAFVSPEGEEAGGAGYTVKYARKIGRKVVIK
jgi:predicted Rossmann fold nucleotide-binding protein DprA/Smf involved in DNA uptake